MLGDYRRLVPPELLLASFAGVAVSIWLWRRTERIASKEAAEIEDRADRNEITEDEAVSLLTNQRFRLASKNFVKTLCVFVLSIGIATPFLAGFPLHGYLRPWGLLAFFVCFVIFYIAVLAMAFWMIEWFSRRDLKKAMSANDNGSR